MIWFDSTVILCSFCVTVKVKTCVITSKDPQLCTGVWFEPLCVSLCVSDEALIALTLVSAEPTSAPLDLFIEDKNDTSVSIIWSQPEVVGHTGLDGYVIEIAKDGSKSLLCLPARCTQCWHVHDRGQIINTPWRKVSADPLNPCESFNFNSWFKVFLHQHHYISGIYN